MMSSIVQKVRKALRHPVGTTIVLSGYEKFKFIPDETYLNIMFKFYMDKKLDLNNPRSYNEKLQWLKLHDRKPEYTIMVDKVRVRELVAQKIGAQYLIPLVGVWDNQEDIDFDKLPNRFVLKCNHNSGLGMCICKDKSKLDYARVRNELKKGLSENYYYLGREWPYKDVPRKIICEKFMVDESGEELRDYKVLCFNGEPKLIELHRGRFTDHQTQDYYDVNWNKTAITQNIAAHYGASTDIAPRPSTLEEMLELSRIMSADIPMVRMDWYSVNGKLYFGEMTFFDGSGFVPYDKEEDDLLIGSWIRLPQ